ncbi:MAG TPA: NADPH-dependent FMN reductase [Methylophilaceae bacterium]
MIKIVGVSGSLSAPSRTRALVENVLEQVTQRVSGKRELIDIADIAREVGTAVSFDQIPAVVSEAHRKLAEADLIVIGTPVYKASYTGLLKHFFDLIDPKQLKGKVAILVATGGSDQHASVLEYQLRPLASFFGIVTSPTAVYARDNEFIDYQLHSETISARVDHAVGQALTLLQQDGRAIALAA